jgi:multiple sugar transport system substrate-binding protein
MPGADGPLRVALVGGPMYDHLYTVFADHGIEVEVVVHADHPTLNRRVAELLHAGERIDILATHSKYAPSQAQWLRPLDELIDRAAVEELASRAVELCRSPDGAAQLCLPRLVDVRVLWARIDRVDVADLDSWDALVRSSTVFGFTGRESGLFGTFFELVAGNGGRLFDDDQRPAIDCEVAIDAIDRLVRLGASDQRSPTGTTTTSTGRCSTVTSMLPRRGRAGGVPSEPRRWSTSSSRCPTPPVPLGG